MPFFSSNMPIMELYSIVLIFNSLLVFWGLSSCVCAVIVDTDSKPPENWRNRQPTDQEVQAVTILQAGLKGHLVREVLKGSRPGKHVHEHIWR